MNYKNQTKEAESEVDLETGASYFLLVITTKINFGR